MAFMDKLKFWKKEDIGADLGLGTGDSPGDSPGMSSSDLGLGMDRTAGLGGTGGLDAPSFTDTSSREASNLDHSSFAKEDTDVSLRGEGFEGGSAEEHFGGPSLQSAPLQQVSASSEIMSKDLEVINAKLDALRATLESMNQRLGAIERMSSENVRKQW